MLAACFDRQALPVILDDPSEGPGQQIDHTEQDHDDAQLNWAGDQAEQRYRKT
jgi:hypothetical protein